MFLGCQNSSPKKKVITKSPVSASCTQEKISLFENIIRFLPVFLIKRKGVLEGAFYFV